MASATVGILRVLLSANTAEFEAALKSAADSVKSWQSNMRSVGDSATALGKVMTTAFTVPLAAIGAGSVKAAMDFETAFSNVAKTVDGVADSTGKLTPKGEALAKVFREMAKEIPATTEELTAIAALGGQMGVSADKLADFTRHVAALGVAVDGISTEEAAAGLAQIGNIAGTGTRDIAQMASALVHLGNSSNATEADILEFTKRLMGAGSTVGMTVQEVMALGTAMANVGINAEAGGTAMSTVISKISKAVSEGGSALNAFAAAAKMSAEDFASKWRTSPIEAIQALILGLNQTKQSGGDLNIVMGELGLGGIRTADTMKRLAGSGKDVTEMLRVSNEGFAAGNKHLEEAEKKYATTANQVKLLWNQVKDLGIELGSALLPIMKSAVQAASSFLPVIEGLVKAFVALPQPVQTGVIAVAALTAAIGPLLIAFGSVMRNAADIIGIFGKKGVATKLLAGELVTLEGVSGKTSTALGVLGKAAGIAAAAFVGWQIGRLIADLTGLDQKIADSVTHMEALQRTRQMAVQGMQGQAAVTAELAKLEGQYAEAVRNGERALAASIQGQIEAIKNDQTRLAVQDTINNAIKKGADANITYAQAVKFLEEKHIANAAAQTAAKVETEKGAAATEKAGVAATNAAQAITKESAATREAEAAARKHAEEIEKQEAALNKLGIVTGPIVTKALADLAAQERLAVAAGADQNAVLAAMMPLYEQLRDKAAASGLAHDELAKAFARAKAGSDALTASYISMAPHIPLEPLSKLPGELMKVDAAGVLVDHTNKMMAESFKVLGVTSQAELNRMADEAEAAYKFIESSGTATAAELKAAWERMVEAQIAAGRRVPSVWETEILPRLKGAFDSIVVSFSDHLSKMMLGMEGFKEGFKGIWESIKQTFASVLSGMLQSWIGGFLKDLFTSGQSMSGQTVSSMGGIFDGGFKSIIGNIGGIMKGGFSAILSGMSALLNPWIAGALAAIGAIFAIFKTGLFRGGEEGTQVNPARNDFLGQFGGTGTGPGSGFYELGVQLEAAVGSAQAEALHAALRQADTMAEFNAAVAAINAALGGGGGTAAPAPGGGGGVHDTSGMTPMPDWLAQEAPEDDMGVLERMARGMADGGFGRVTRPTLFLAGEAGPEDYSFNPVSKGGLATTPSVTVNFNGHVLAEREYIQTTVIDAVNEAWRMNRHSAFTRSRASLGIA